MKLSNILKAFAFISLFLATIGGALAVPAMPHPVYGTVTLLGEIIPFEEVELSSCDFRTSTATFCNVRTTDKFQTDSTGSYMFEMANINPSWRPGDLIQLKACIGHPNCVIITELGDSGTQIDFDIGATLPPNTVIVPGETIEKERTVYVPDPDTVQENEDLKVRIADVETNMERLKAAMGTTTPTETKGFSWWHGFIALVIFCIGLGGTKGYNMLKTVMQKNNKKGYGK